MSLSLNRVKYVTQVFLKTSPIEQICASTAQFITLSWIQPKILNDLLYLHFKLLS